MTNSDDQKQKNNGAIERAGCIFGAIIPLVIFSVVLFAYFLSKEKERHIVINNVKSICENGWFGTVSCKYPEIAISDLSDGVYYGKVLLPVFAFAILYPFIGRILFEVANMINNAMMKILKIDASDVLIDGRLEISAFWPLLLIVIPIQLLALVFAFAYTVAIG